MLSALPCSPQQQRFENYISSCRKGEVPQRSELVKAAGWMPSFVPLLWEMLCSEILRARAPAHTGHTPWPQCAEKSVAKDEECDTAVARSQNIWGVLRSFYLGLITRGFSTQQQLIPSTIKKNLKIGFCTHWKVVQMAHTLKHYWRHTAPQSPAGLVIFSGLCIHPLHQQCQKQNHSVLLQLQTKRGYLLSEKVHGQNPC